MLERRRKRIIIACSSAINEGKGILTYSKILAESLKEEYEVHFYSKYVNTDDWFEFHNIAFLHFHTDKSSQENVTNLYEYIQENGIDYIINNDVIYVNILKPAIKVPVVNVFHLTRYAILSSALLNARFINRHIVISNDMLKTITKKKVDASKITKVLNAINISDINYNKKDFSKLRIFCGTENTDRKGGKDIVRLIRMLKKSKTEFDFVWVGKKTNKIKSELEDDKRFTVELRLPRDEFLTVMEKSNIYLFPSNEEGCPMSLKEAMAQGLVPIAKDSIGAMNEIITHGKDGFLLQPKDWINSTHKIITNFDSLQNRLGIMSVNANKKIVNEFNSDRLKQDYIDLLNEIDKETTANSEIKELSDLAYYNWHRLPYPSTINGIADIIARIRFRFGILEKSNVK